MNRDTVRCSFLRNPKATALKVASSKWSSAGGRTSSAILRKGKLFNFVKPDEVKLLQDIVISDEN